MHTAYSGSMSVQGVCTLPGVGVPDFQSSVSGTADDDVAGHLRWPDTAGVANQGTKTLKTVTRESLMWLFLILHTIWNHHKDRHHIKRLIKYRREDAHYLAGDRWPDLEGVVVGTADDLIAAEFEAGDDVIIMTLEHLEVDRWIFVGYFVSHINRQPTWKQFLADGRGKDGAAIM